MEVRGSPGADVAQDLRDGPVGLESGVSEHDDVGVWRSFQQRQSACRTRRQKVLQLSRLFSVPRVLFLKRSDDLLFPGFREERALGKDHGDRVFVDSSRQLSNRLEFCFEVLGRPCNEPVAHPMPDQVDVRLAAQVLFERVQGDEATIAEDHRWKHRIEEAPVTANDDCIASQYVGVQLVQVHGYRHDRGDDAAERRGPCGHHPKKPSLGARFVDMEAQGTDEPDNTDHHEPRQIDRYQAADKDVCAHPAERTPSIEEVEYERHRNRNQGERGEQDGEDDQRRDTYRSTNPWTGYLSCHDVECRSVAGAITNHPYPVRVKVSVAGLAAMWRGGVSRQAEDLRNVPVPQAGDFVGGVSVALVLIPQSLAYATIAGVPPYVGLFASALPLLAFSLVSSSPYLQTGPVALTSLLTAGALATTGAPEATPEYVALAAVLAIIVGFVRLAIGALRLGSIVYLMAEPVMIGFTSAAGIVIFSSQLPKAFGVEPPDWPNPLREAIWAIGHPGEWNIEAVFISVVTLVLMLKGRSVHRLFPGVLIAVILALAYSVTTDYDGPIVGEIDAGLPALSLDLPWGEVGTLLVGGFVIALVGFAEPASIARTFANEEQSEWSSSREFFASGLANIVSGVSGAFPVGGSFSRSSVNRFAGAQTRWSGAVTGLVVLGFLPFAGALERLPNAVLGAIVVGAVISLIKPKRLVWLWLRSPWQAALAWGTWLATLITPPNVERAVLFGVLLTVILHFMRRFHLETDDNAPSGELRLRARGLLWSVTTAKLASELVRSVEEDTGTGDVVLSLDRVTAIDSQIAKAIVEGNEAAKSVGRSFRVVDAPHGAGPILEKMGVPTLEG